MLATIKGCPCEFVPHLRRRAEADSIDVRMCVEHSFKACVLRQVRFAAVGIDTRREMKIHIGAQSRKVLIHCYLAKSDNADGDWQAHDRFQTFGASRFGLIGSAVSSQCEHA